MPAKPVHSKALTSLLTAALAVTALVAVAAPSSAAARTTANWHFASADVDESTPISALYDVGTLPRGGKVVLQRQTGTAGVWRAVAQSKTPAGAFTSTAPAMGQYAYRLAVLDSRGKAVASAKQTLRAYREIDFVDLLGQGSQTVQIGGTLFRYPMTSGTVGRTYKWDNTSCRSLALNVAMKSSSSDYTGKASVVQERGDAVEVMVKPGQIVPLATPLYGGAFQIVMSTSSGNSYSFANGAASCWTSNGKA